MKNVFRFIAIVFILLGISLTVPAQTHFVDPRTKTIERMGAMGEGALYIGKPLIYLQFTASPSGRLMYIEDLDSTARLSLGAEHAYYGELRESYLKKHHQPYAPDRITKVLHVTDPEGKDLYVVPIADKHGPFSSYYGEFLNERQIVIKMVDRRGVTNHATVIDCVQRKVWTWIQMGAFLIDQIEASPNGKSFVVTLENDKTKHKLLYYDGCLVLPYFDDKPPLPTDAPELYSQRVAALNARLQAEYPGGFDFTMDRQGAWSADGRFLAVTQSNGFDDRHTSASAAWAPSVLIVEPEKAAAGRDYRDYSLRLPFNLSKSRREVVRPAEAPGQEPGIYSPVARFVNGALEIATTGMQSGSLLRVPLPADWQERTIRKDLAASPAK